MTGAVRPGGRGLGQHLLSQSVLVSAVLVSAAACRSDVGDADSNGYVAPIEQASPASGSDSRSSDAVGHTAPVTYDELLANLDRQLAARRVRAESREGDWLSWAAVADLALQRARLSGDYGDYAVADQAIEAAFARAPHGSGPFLGRAALNVALHRLDRVESDLASAEAAVLVDDVTRAVILGLRGDVALQRGEYARAELLYDEAVAQRRDLSTLTRVAHLRHATGDFESAEALFIEAATVLPRSATRLRAWLELQRGLLDLERGRLDEALDHYRAGDAILGGWWLILEHQAEILALTGREPEALAIYEAIIAQDRHPEMLAAAAAVVHELGGVERAAALTAEAREAFVARLTAFPEAASGHALSFFLETAPGDPLTLELAERNYALRPGGESSVWVAQARLAADRPESAREAVERALTSPFRSAELHRTAVLVFERLGDAQRAAQQRDLAVAINARSFGE